MIILIDNYDSFTYNIVQVLGDCGAQNVQVYRNNKISATDVFKQSPDAIILSPGPGTPDESGVCLDILQRYKDGDPEAYKIPLLGICLGHQSVGQLFGGNIIKAPEPIHGKTSSIQHNNQGLFKDVQQNTEVARYHSLIIEKDTCPDCLEITAHYNGDIIMAVQHKTLPLYGLQFHPESIATQDGQKLLQNFLTEQNISS